MEIAMMSKEQISSLKDSLAEAVSEKKSLTQQRMVLKRIPFKTRTGEQHAQMLRLRSAASDQKSAVRVLQLAYAYARGRAYWTQERKPSHGAVLGQLAIGIASILPVTAEEAILWLRVRMTTEEQTAFALHERTSREVVAAARRERAAARVAAAE
jgi:hypothetical protein